MNSSSTVYRRALIGLLLSLIAGVGIGISVDSGDGGKTRTIHITLPAKTPPPAGDLQAAPPPSTDPATIKPSESDLRDQTPPDVPHAVLQAGKEKTDQLGTDAKVSDTAKPVGGAQNYSVTKDFSGHVYSDFFSNIAPTEFCLHYTVSPNITGWGDIRGVQGFFKRTMAASSTYIVDFEGHILQMVPLTHKAWTQGTFNPYCRASVEIIATGSETRAQWLNSTLIKGHILSSLMHDVMKSYNLPLRFVDPVGCVAPAGYTDHDHIECGNDHTDVGHQFPFDELKRQLGESFTPKPISTRTKVVCRRYAWFGRPGSPLAKSRSAKQRKAHGERRRYLVRNHIKCSPKGVATRA